MGYCPNCGAAIAAPEHACWNCDADFGPGAAWHPVAEPPVRPPRVTVGRVPELPGITNVLPASALIALFGPAVGATLLLLRNDGHTPGAALFFLYLGAYAFAAPAAIVAALVFGALAMGCVRLGSLDQMSSVLTILLGGLSGFVGTAMLQFFYARSIAPVSNGFSELYVLSFLSGALLSAASSHRFPIGKRL